MTDELAVLFDVVDRLDSVGIAYMVTGSIALAAYAVPRMTRDIDIVIRFTGVEADRVIAAFQTNYYLDETAARYAIHHQEMFNLIDQRTCMKVDFIVRKDQDYRIEEFTRRRQNVVSGKMIWIVAPEDLILSKLLWVKESESELQLRDVRLLMETVTDLDVAYLNDWAARLGVTELLRKALQHA